MSQEHVPLLSQVPGWRRSRRYRPVDTDTLTDLNYFIAAHEYAAENGLETSDEIKHARSTPWRSKIFSLLGSHTRRKLERYCDLSPAPRDLVHLPSNQIVIDTTIPHDGYRLHYRLEGSTDDSGPVVIFCNGLNTNLNLWDPVIALLKHRFPNFRYLRYGG